MVSLSANALFCRAVSVWCILAILATVSDGAEPATLSPEKSPPVVSALFPFLAPIHSSSSPPLASTLGLSRAAAAATPLLSLDPSAAAATFAQGLTEQLSVPVGQVFSVVSPSGLPFSPEQLLPFPRESVSSGRGVQTPPYLPQVLSGDSSGPAGLSLSLVNAVSSLVPFLPQEEKQRISSQILSRNGLDISETEKRLLQFAAAGLPAAGGVLTQEDAHRLAAGLAALSQPALLPAAAAVSAAAAGAAAALPEVLQDPFNPSAALRQLPIPQLGLFSGLTGPDNGAKGLLLQQLPQLPRLQLAALTERVPQAALQTAGAFLGAQ